MDLFIFRNEGRGALFWHSRAGRMFRTWLPYMRRRLDFRDVRRGQRAADFFDKEPDGENSVSMGLVSGKACLREIVRYAFTHSR